MERCLEKYILKDLEKSSMGQPQGIAPTKKQIHGENNSRVRPCACPQEIEDDPDNQKSKKGKNFS